MKAKTIFGISALLVVLLCCHKESITSDYKSKGVILGPDFRMCACCGGYFIQIDSSTYEFDALPESSDIDLQKETFPVSVNLDWQLANTGACTANKIIITRIKKE